MISRPNPYLAYFVSHPVASNILMALAFLLGWYAYTQINVQLLPSYRVNMISIVVGWPQADAEAVERHIINPIEAELQGLAGIESVKSSSKSEVGSVFIKFKSNVPMDQALVDVKSRVDLVKNWPRGVKEPRVQERESFDLVTSVLLWADVNWYEFKRLAKTVEQQLLSLGMDKIEVVGVSDEELILEVDPVYAQRYPHAIDEMSRWISGQNLGAVSLGDYYQGNIRYQLNMESDFFHPLLLSTMRIPQKSGGWHILSDEFSVDYRLKKGQSQIRFQQMPAASFMVMRSAGSNALTMADVVERWYESSHERLPDVAHIKLYNKIWKYIHERLELMLNNGVQGLLLIAFVVWLFFRFRILRWVILGIPIAFSLSLFFLYLSGGSINQIALFGFIMALGIVVDDTIVVCEAVVQAFERGRKPWDAVVEGLQFMSVPILISSFTTVAAFLPLIALSGAMGDILTAIPIVVVVVIIASLVECFLILPRHLYLDFLSIEKGVRLVHPARVKLDAAWVKLRDRYLVAGVQYLLDRPVVSVGMVGSLLLLTFSIFYSGHVAFTFFPMIPGQDIYADVRFVSGTTPERMKHVLSVIERAAYEVQENHRQNDKPMIEMTYQNMHRTSLHRSARGLWGDQFLASNIYVRLSPPDGRELDNDAFIQAWSERIPSMSSIDVLTIEQPKSGPPTQDIRLTLVGDDLMQLKLAAGEIKSAMSEISGVINVEDNMPYDLGSLRLVLNQDAIDMGLSASDIADQLSVVTRGIYLATDRNQTEDLDLRLSFPEQDTDILDVLYSYPVILPAGEAVALSSLVEIEKKAGFERVRHYQNNRVINVLADIDSREANRNQVLQHLRKSVIPDVVSRYAVDIDYSDQSRMEKETLREMKYGLGVALVLIYFLLAWGFSSFLLPFMVLLTMPLSLIGAIWGHYWMGFDLSILSLMGFFGLMGIIVNDSIILIRTYQALRLKGVLPRLAVIESVTRRLRPVILTTLTTVLGLAPLMFESSFQAQFLIPMAISITFGLAVGTFLVFMTVPLMLDKMYG